MSEHDPTVVDKPDLDCDGGGGGGGHPRVYLKIAADGEIVCPYCSRRFILGPGGRDS
jgi:uncharacterized Zn-finger protein